MIQKNYQITALAPNECPSNATGTYPDCECTDTKHVYNGTANKCEECTGEQIAISATKCGCPAGTAPGDNDTCNTISVTIQCNENDPNVIVDTTTGTCSCINGYQLDGQNCVCPPETHETNDQGLCVKIQTNIIQNIIGTAVPQPVPETTILPAKNLFELNSAELTQDAEKAIEDFAADVINKQGNNTTYCITVDGYTDTSGTSEYNLALSTQRANAVKNALQNAQIPETNIKATGHGETNCKYDDGTTVPDGTIHDDCRRVEIGFSPNECQ